MSTSNAELISSAVVVRPAGDRTGQAGAGEATARYDTYRTLFDTFTRQPDGTVAALEVIARLRQAGLTAEDSRIRDAFTRVDDNGGQRRGLTAERFAEICRTNGGVVARALRGELVIPDFAGFAAELAEVYERLLDDDRGAVADYIPQLGNVEPDQLAIAVCTVDGQRFALGESTVGFTIQSVCKPINYCLALEEHGSEVVHRHVGHEPSGRGFNELAFDQEGLPHNPMINSGAIMCCSLLKRQLDMADRFEYVANAWRRLSGSTRVGFNNAVYLSERASADRNFVLGYSMRESRAFPTGTDLTQTLEFYFQCCAIEVDAEAVAVVAATLANGGLSPTAGGHVLSTGTVQRCLSLMSSCGMYDYSGEFAFEIGLPAKSGVSGALMIVVPKVMGICVWSPRLDRNGNSVRGIEFCRQLVSRYNFHPFDGLVDGDGSGKRDPRRRRDLPAVADASGLCWVASLGDLEQLRSLVQAGADPNLADYDGRTPLHLAAAEGHRDVVGYLLDRGVDANPVDRWGGTPIGDAERAGHADVVALLRPSTVHRVGAEQAARPPVQRDRAARKAFVDGYTRLLSQAWSGGELARRLETQPEAVLAGLGLPTVAGARVTIVRTLDPDPDLDAQAALWERGHATGQYLLYIPQAPPLGAGPDEA
jgi:glutaminase